MNSPTVREVTIQETAEGASYNFRALVNWADIITNKFIENRGGEVWSINDQIAHVHSEVSEVFQAIRHGEELDRVFEENIDVILSAVTLLSIIQLNYRLSHKELNEHINRALMTVTKKLYERAGIPIK